MKEIEKMLLGKIYDPSDEEIYSLRHRAHSLCLAFNQLDEEDPKRKEIIEELLNTKENLPFLQGPVYFDYGRFTKWGKNCFANFNLTVLDISPVTIGDDVFIGPNVSIVTPIHPYLPKERAVYQNEKGVLTDKEYSKPITIGKGTWIASNVTIIGGVTIGEGCIIGAGSVVTHSIPPFSLVAGNPCRVIRKLTEEDSIYLKKELF